MRAPAILRQLRAFFTGYFWAACPRCGKHFAGYEKGGGREMLNWNGGRITCPNCPYDRLNGHFINGPDRDEAYIDAHRLTDTRRDG